MTSNKQQQQPPSTRNAYIFMSLAGVAILALVGWALSRSFNAPVSGRLPPPADTFAAPSQTSSSSPADEEKARTKVARISAEDLHQRLQRNEVTVIDVRNAEAFASGHIPGSMLMPLASIEAQIAFLPKAKPIVTYCT